MTEQFGWQRSIVDCFVAYLAGHNRPVHEVLFPKKLPLEPAFTNEFAGMTRDAVALTLLENTQERLLAQLPRAVSESHRHFLLSLVSAEPAWDLMPFAHLQHLPALQWKLLNLRKLKTRDPTRSGTCPNDGIPLVKKVPMYDQGDEFPPVAGGRRIYIDFKFTRLDKASALSRRSL